MLFKSDIDVNLVQSVGGDHSVVAAARVSTSAADSLQYYFDRSISENDNNTGEEMRKLDSDNFSLINYLMKHRHGTPFEHSSMTFYVHAPIFVWREWHRHRIGFSYNEESARYKKLDPVFYLPDRERPMFCVPDWKPGRPKFLRIDSPEREVAYNTLCANLKESFELSYSKYLENLYLGVDPGLARDCLPVGIYSGCWVTCNPRSLMAFLSLRTHSPNAQFISYPLWEIQLAAIACEQVFAQGWPLTFRAYVENGRVAP